MEQLSGLPSGTKTDGGPGRGTKGMAGAVRSLLGKGLAMSPFPKTGDQRITGFRKDIPGERTLPLPSPRTSRFNCRWRLFL